MTTTPANIQTFRSGDAARDEAIERVERNADPDFKARALQKIKEVCIDSADGWQQGTGTRRFTTDDIWDALGDDFPLEPRVMGALMVKAQRLGWCMATEDYRKSRRPECHSRPIRVWLGLAGARP